MFKSILCFLGWHQWVASLDDYIEEFGCIPLGNKICSKAVCSRCGKKYKDKKDEN